MKYPVNFEIEFRKHNYPGKFIVFEGVDASGKTTQAEELVGKLKEKGIKAIYTKEPTDGQIGQFIRQILTGEIKLPPISLQYLFCADRGEHQIEIEQYLKEGYTVISDRYFWSSVAYGISDLGGVADYYLTIFSVLSFYNQFITPDFNFYLDVDIDEAVRRIDQSHKHKEIYDNREKIVKIKKAYEELIERFKEEFRIIDANEPVEEVSKKLLEQIEKVIK